MAIKTKGVISRVSELDSEWCFCHILGIPPLMGGDIKILSPFTSEKTPSFSIYKKDNRPYMYKCFSSNRSGNYLNLFIELNFQKGLRLSENEAMDILKKQYEEFLSGGGHAPSQLQIALNGKGVVTSWEMRSWSDDDRSFWGRFCITENILEDHNVVPIRKFTMEKLKNGVMQIYPFEHGRTYGYLRKDGSLHKLYRPGSKKGKYIKVGGDYLEGSDQITGPANGMIVMKSLKDIMGWKALEIEGWHLEAPSSENVMLPAIAIKSIVSTYPNRYTFMDNDEAGRRASDRYLKEHGIPSLGFDLGYKDLTDTIEALGPVLTRLKILSLL